MPNLRNGARGRKKIWSYFFVLVVRGFFIFFVYLLVCFDCDQMGEHVQHVFDYVRANGAEQLNRGRSMCFKVKLFTIQSARPSRRAVVSNEC